MKEWKRKSWTRTKSKRSRKGPSKAKAIHWNGKECEEAQNTGLESGEKIVGGEGFKIVRGKKQEWDAMDSTQKFLWT